MSRRRKKIKLRTINIINKYRCYILFKFTNIIMKQGKKYKALSILYKTFCFISNVFFLNPYYIFKISLRNIRPRVEIKSKRVGGTTYRIPIKINYKRSIFIAMKWLKRNSLKNRKNSFYISLALEIVSSYFNTGDSIKNRDLVHKNAELNRAFSHFVF